MSTWNKRDSHSSSRHLKKKHCCDRNASLNVLQADHSYLQGWCVVYGDKNVTITMRPWVSKTSGEFRYILDRRHRTCKNGQPGIKCSSSADQIKRDRKPNVTRKILSAVSMNIDSERKYFFILIISIVFKVSFNNSLFLKVRYI